MWSIGNILISGIGTLVQYLGEGYNEDSFSGIVLESEHWEKGTIDNGWNINGFTLATIENTPSKWHKYLIDKDKEYSIRNGEKYKYSEEFLYKKFKIVEDLGDICLIELINTKIEIRTFIPKFDIKELNNCDELKEAKGNAYSQILSNILKEEINNEKINL